MSKGPTGPQYHLQFENFPDHLYVHVSVPELTEETVVAYIRETADEVATRGCRRVLIVRDIEGTLTDAVNYRISEATVDWFKGIRVAWVNPYPDQIADVQFFVDVAANRGGNYRLFSDTDTAREWLLR